MNKNKKITLGQAYKAMYALLYDYSKTLYGDEKKGVTDVLSSMEFFPFEEHSADPRMWSDFKYYSQEAVEGNISIVKESLYPNDDYDARAIKKYNIKPGTPRDFLAEDNKK